MDLKRRKRNFSNNIENEKMFKCNKTWWKWPRNHLFSKTTQPKKLYKYRKVHRCFIRSGHVSISWLPKERLTTFSLLFTPKNPHQHNNIDCCVAPSSGSGLTTRIKFTCTHTHAIHMLTKHAYTELLNVLAV